jgi:hypothetical protein
LRWDRRERRLRRLWRPCAVRAYCHGCPGSGARRR